MLHQKQHTIKQEIVPTVESLICALLALTPNEYLFKRLRIKIDIYRYKTSLITNEETISEFYKLLKLRHLSSPGKAEDKKFLLTSFLNFLNDYFLKINFYRQSFYGLDTDK